MSLFPEVEKLSTIDALKFTRDPMLDKIGHRRREASRISQYFDDDTKQFILDCVNGEYDDDETANVNKIAELITNRLEPLGFKEIGVGSNRIAYLKNGYVYKIAMDRRGCIDNMSEYLRSPEEPQMLMKVYETNRLIAVAEYGRLISAEEFAMYKDKIRDMLTYLARRYVIQDLGLTPKNFCNVALRDNGQIIFIDFAYMYKIAGNEDALRCKLCGGYIEPNSDFTAYRCSNSQCGQTYLAYELLNHMKRDVDECDDEQVIKMIGTDDQGTDSSNFTYVKLTGEDTGEMEFISEEESEELKKKIELRAAEEADYLSRATSVDEVTIDSLVPEEKPEEVKPHVRMKSEGTTALSFEEFTAISNMIYEKIETEKEGTKNDSID